MSSSINLFISYSHKDEAYVDSFVEHLAPIESNGLIRKWHDRDVLVGEDLFDAIDKKLISADIICLFVSSSYFASRPCMDEKADAFKLRNEKGISVFPIIVRPCSWIEDDQISSVLGSPTDNKPVKNHENKDSAWVDVTHKLKKTAKKVKKIKSLSVSDSFKENFLNDAGFLVHSHPRKESLRLDDIFVYPDLDKESPDSESVKYNAEKLEKELRSLGKVVISGGNQSGKTTLSKKVFKIYRDLGLVPVYIQDDHRLLGNPETKVKKALEDQYEQSEIRDLEKSDIAIIIDDFHKAKHKDKILGAYDDYEHQTLFIDDLLEINFRNENLLKEHTSFSIRELSPSLRDELCRKWLETTEAVRESSNPNHLYKKLDAKTKKVDLSLGKVMGKGIMPSHPFFILTLLSAQETANSYQDITSQGHCYQALIYLYLKKQGVTDDQIDAYMNFLTELAFSLFERNEIGFTENEFDLFVERYKEKYNLPIDVREIEENLGEVGISKYDGLGNYNFCYPYLYYFFVAKYLSENLRKNKNKIDTIINNLHNTKNAYIAIFISHHSKSDYILDEIILNALVLFDDFEPATLSKTDLSFFDNHEEKIVEATLPPSGESPEERRKERLLSKDQLEERQSKIESHRSPGSDDQKVPELVKKLRKSLKTVEVMGQIVKNRYGSLESSRLEQIYEAGLLLVLRILSSFFDIIEEKEAQDDIVDYILHKIIVEAKNKGGSISVNSAEELAKNIFWNMNFYVILGLVKKAVHSLGSDKLLTITQTIDEKLDYPSSFIVRQGIKMWFDKSLSTRQINERLERGDFSQTAIKVLKYKVVEHSQLHKIGPKGMTKIKKSLDIPRASLIKRE